MGKSKKVSIDKNQIGEYPQSETRDKIPVDGMIAEDKLSIDESNDYRGEPIPVNKWKR